MSYIITSTKLRNIADAVRYKCGGYLMNITTMIQKISQLKQSEGIIDVSPYSGDMALWNAIRIATFDTDIINTSTMTSMKGMFGGWPFTSLDFQGFDTSSATDMAQMFEDNQATSLKNLTDFDTSNVTTIREQFERCINLTSLDLSGWDVTSVILADYTFHGCTSLQSIDLSGWDTRNVTNMDHMFGSMRNSGGKIWVPSTFVATKVSYSYQKPFYAAPCNSQQLPFSKWDLYTDATDAATQGWGTIHSNFVVHYNSTHQDFLNA